ncbi:MAG: phosphodiester glycosidase family protein [Myxococcales bacterium]
MAPLPLPLLSALLLLAVPPTADLAWRTLEPGLETAQVPLPVKSDVGDSTLTVLRIDPARFELSILGVKSLGLPDRIPAATWLKERGLVAVTNAGMFKLEDGVSTVGYARAGTKVLNGDWKKEYGAALVFGPRKAGLPAVQILDRGCDDLVKASADYDYVMQSIRMIDCKGRNSWGPRKQRYSSVIAAVDAAGRLLFLHCRSPYVMHDYIGQLLKLPGLGLKRAIYLEGGPEATLHVESGATKVVRVGSYETSFWENDGNHDEWGLPNVIAVRRSAPTSP